MNRYFIYILIAILLWVAGAYWGYGYNISLDKSIINQNKEAYTTILNSSAWGIFWNNLSLCFLCLLGSLFLGIPTIINLVFNGFIAGQTISNSIHTIGYNDTLAVAAPHSIEFISLWMSAALSFYLTPLLYRWVVKGDRNILFSLKQIWWSPLIIIILLAIAATIESLNMSRL